MNSNHFYAASAFFNGLFGLFLVYYIYLRNKKSPVNRSFLYFGISVTGWSLIYAMWGWASDAKVAEFFLRRHMIFEAFIPATFFHFCAHFSGRYITIKKWVFLAYALSFAYSLGMLTPWMIAGVRPVMFFKYWPVPGPFLLSHVIYFIVVVATSLGLLAYNALTSTGPDRRRAAWVLTAFTIGFGGGSVNWFLWFDIPIPPTTNFFVGLMFAIVAYAMVRHGLMDIDSIVEILKVSRASSLGILASGMNHELRNPLYIAKGRIESQLDAIERQTAATVEEEAMKSREVLASALCQLCRAMDIMQRFSDFARPSRKKTEVETVPVRDVVEDVLALVSNEFELRKIRFDGSALNGEFVRANRRQMEEVFFNLIMNACHAMEKIGGTLSVRSAREKGRVVVEVSDTGAGISKETQRKIFEPFNSTKEGKGMGLGLYITKQLVELNGGKIFVKSKPGATSFRMEFGR